MVWRFVSVSGLESLVALKVIMVRAVVKSTTILVIWWRSVGAGTHRLCIVQHAHDDHVME
jgi:hypothetical protein